MVMVSFVCLFVFNMTVFKYRYLFFLLFSNEKFWDVHLARFGIIFYVHFLGFFSNEVQVLECDILSKQWRKESVRKVIIFNYRLRIRFQVLISNTWNGI